MRHPGRGLHAFSALDDLGDRRRNGIMELEEARALVKEKTDKDVTVRHLVSVEG